MRAPPVRDRKELLIVVDTLLGYRTSMKYWSVIADDPRVNATLTFTRNEYDAGVREAVEDSGLPVISIDEANRRKWDLGLFATDQGREYITAQMPKIKVPHGIGSPSKLYDGINFAYSRIKLLDASGTPYYDWLIEPSRTTAEQAIARLPELQGHLRVTGSLDMDELERTARRKKRLRKDFGFEKDDIVVLITSTWNEEGLILGHGEALIEAARQLPPNFKVLMTVHPNLLAKQSPEADDWRVRLDGLPHDRFRICGLHESWMAHLGVADLAIIDHSSIGLYFNGLRRPVIGVPISANVLDPQSTIGQVLRGSPTLDHDEPLHEQIEHAIASFDSSALEFTREQVRSYPGEARRRIREVFSEALALGPFTRNRSNRSRLRIDHSDGDIQTELCELYTAAEKLARAKRVTRRHLQPKPGDPYAQSVLESIARLETEIGEKQVEGDNQGARLIGARAAWAEECRRTEAGISTLTGSAGHAIRAFWGRSVIATIDKRSDPSAVPNVSTRRYDVVEAEQKTGEPVVPTLE